ncbi:hypothetical protein EVAR_19382_1 [Eumeta japonica]|uniref:Uncharacterized protein n=1 Tax=Eumeta variegata TaxID=151549 RepID=A0A4C1TRI3_EUMVA|nr:hypothetical protein EVAR_19382_1 [Eumeta japonica]
MQEYNGIRRAAARRGRGRCGGDVTRVGIHRVAPSRKLETAPVGFLKKSSAESLDHEYGGRDGRVKTRRARRPPRPGVKVVGRVPTGGTRSCRFIRGTDHHNKGSLGPARRLAFFSCSSKKKKELAPAPPPSRRMFLPFWASR